jgi:hypothetical protein
MDNTPKVGINLPYRSGSTVGWNDGHAVGSKKKMSEGCCRTVMLAALRMLDRPDGTAHLYLANDCVGQGRRRQNDSTCKICRGDRCCNVRVPA